MGLVDKFNITGVVDNSYLNKNIATLATESELKFEQEKIAKLQAFGSSYFRDKSILKILKHKII